MANNMNTMYADQPIKAGQHVSRFRDRQRSDSIRLAEESAIDEAPGNLDAEWNSWMLPADPVEGSGETDESSAQHHRFQQQSLFVEPVDSSALKQRKITIEQTVQPQSSLNVHKQPVKFGFISSVRAKKSPNRTGSIITGKSGHLSSSQGTLKKTIGDEQTGNHDTNMSALTSLLLIVG